MKKKILAVLLATGVVATTLLGGSILVSAADDGGNTAQARTLDEIKEDGKIKIGVFSDKNPFGYVDENGDVQGYDVYFGKRLAKDLLGSEDDVEFTYVEAASRVEYLQSAKVDVILANFTVTDERAEKVDFALPYMKVALGVVSPDDALIKDVKDLEGKKLIVVKGTTAETYFTDNYPDIELVKFDEYQEAYDALLDGRGDAFSTDNTEVLAWAQQNEGFSVGIESLGDIDTIAPAVQKGNTDLLNAINDEIKSLADEQFFHKDFEETLKPVYGDNINPDDLVVEGGVVDSEEKAEDADAAADAAEEAAQNGVTDKSQQEDIQDTTNAKSFNDGNVKIYASDLTASSTLAQYCTILFKNNVEIQNMLNGCGMEITQEQESNFLWITMTSSNPKIAADTCNAVVNKITGTKNEQGLFDEIFSAGGVTAVKYASVPSASTYPNVKNYALYGLIGGLALSLVISFILELVDTTVKHDDDLNKMYKIFGEIMDFEQNGDDTDETKK